MLNLIGVLSNGFKAFPITQKSGSCSKNVLTLFGEYVTISINAGGQILFWGRDLISTYYHIIAEPMQDSIT